ncbi:MAG: FAD-binding protein [Clostridia bacterium]
MEKFDAIIVGSGAAAYSTADWLFKYDIKNIAIVTENRLAGTSRNTGSDKQTYYKISMVGDSLDSNLQMAQSMFDGGSMNGDIALIEASNSARCFLRLVEYGAPFPTNEFGEYVGYKTDHDNTARATSCGPLTSKFMTECLEKKVCANGTKIFDKTQALQIIVQDNVTAGLIVANGDNEMQVLQTRNVILATGGEASVYRDSVYPLGQSGGSALGINAGVTLHNFQEWQYGMSSTKFRWNVSGSYQQAIPRYVSVDKNGVEKEFLADRFNSPQDAYNMVFLKGYQWPFDSKKTDGSSQIDLLVNDEISRGNKVFLDFRTNPVGYDFDKLSQEAQEYLTNANCVCDTPLERLRKLNGQAIEVYSMRNIDLSQEMLQIAICAQHNNGGLGIDSDWQTNVKGVFAVGEVAGTFGVYRQGGSALNSTQVGGLRVAQYLASKQQMVDMVFDFDFFVAKERAFVDSHIADVDNLAEVTKHFQALMSQYGGASRDCEKLQIMLAELQEYIDGKKPLTIADKKDIKKLYKCWDMLICDYFLCKTMIESIARVGSRGGSVSYMNGKIVQEEKKYREMITLTDKNGIMFVERRPIPSPNNNFEMILNDTKKENITNDKQY